MYGQNPDVIFDLFNEPRRASLPTEAGTWKFWKHGGDYDGYHFIGMEPLARYIRGLGARNLFWIEGPHTAGTLDEVVTHQITDAGPVEYAINHPGGLNAPAQPGRVVHPVRVGGREGPDDRHRVDQLFIHPRPAGRTHPPACRRSCTTWAATGMGLTRVDADPGRARRVR